MSKEYDIDKLVSDISLLEINKPYKYVKLRGDPNNAKSCQLVSVDLTSKQIRYLRCETNEEGNFSLNTLVTVANALNTKSPIDLNVVLAGSGNNRSILESLLANTPEIFVCQVDSKKNIFWNPSNKHEIGKITVSEPLNLAIENHEITGSKEESSKTIGEAYLTYLAAIRTKPFILLAGISGTGKSRLVRQLARSMCPDSLADDQKPGNFEMIQVRPNWHDSTELMGYVSRISGKPEYILTDFVRFLAKAWLFKEIPFFLCLDEMNLAPVEQYFAEYLSVIETRKLDLIGEIRTDVLVKFPRQHNVVDEVLEELFMEEWAKPESHGNVTAMKQQFKQDGGIRIPPNLVVMGTVNMDETTFSFSRKVLDRAMSFELNEINLREGLNESCDDIEDIPPEAAKARFVETVDFYAEYQEVSDKVIDYLEEVNKHLERTPFKVAYRTRNEIMIYCVERLRNEGSLLAQALDEATSMKILSRIEGDEQRISDTWLSQLKAVINNQLKGIYDSFDIDNATVCGSKLDQMVEQLKRGYVSFWS